MEFKNTRVSLGRPLTSYSKVRAILGPVLRTMPTKVRDQVERRPESLYMEATRP